MLLFIINLKKAALKYSKNLIFIMQLIQLCIRFLTQRLYAVFKDEKQPTSSSCSRCDECGGMQRVIIFFSLQSFLNSSKLQLLQLSRISRQYALVVRSFVCALKCFNYLILTLFIVQLLLVILIAYVGGILSSQY